MIEDGYYWAMQRNSNDGPFIIEVTGAIVNVFKSDVDFELSNYIIISKIESPAEL